MIIFRASRALGWLAIYAISACVLAIIFSPLMAAFGPALFMGVPLQ